MVTSVFNTATKKAKKKRDDLLGKPLMSKMTAPPINNKQQDKQQLDYNIKPVTEFKKDGTVSYSVGGKSFDLTKEEFKAMQGKGGQITPTVKAGQEASQEYSQAESIKRQLKQGADTLRITEQILAANRPKGFVMPSIEELQAQPKTTPTPTDEGLLPQVSESLGLPRQKGFGEAVSTITKDVKGFVAKSIDVLRVGITGKKPLDVQQAEETFNNINEALTQSIPLIKTGEVNAGDLIEEVESAYEAINRLEATQKGIGKENVRYWADEGAEVEAQILLNKKKLERRLAEINAASIEASLNQARVSYGQ